MSKQWSSFKENQQHTDAWREFLTEEMDKDAKKARFGGRPEDCPPCPECPDEQGGKEELEWVDVDASQATETIKGFQDLNQDLFQGRLDDGAIMREYQQFLRDQNIKIMDQGKELDLSELRNPFRRRQATSRGAMEHERKPKIGKLENLEKYPNLYKLVVTGLKSDDYQKAVLTIFQNAGFGDVREFASAYIQAQPEEQPAQQQQQAAEQPAEEPAEQPGEQPGEEVPGDDEGGTEAPAPGTAVKQGDSYVYTSKKGNKGVVQVTNPLPDHPEAAQVTQLNPETCEPASKRVFATGVKNLGEPYDKCDTPQAEGVEHDDKVLLEKWHKLAGIIKG